MVLATCLMCRVQTAATSVSRCLCIVTFEMTAVTIRTNRAAVGYFGARLILNLYVYLSTVSRQPLTRSSSPSLLESSAWSPTWQMDRPNPKRHQPDAYRPLEAGPWTRSSWTSDATAHDDDDDDDDDDLSVCLLRSTRTDMDFLSHLGGASQKARTISTRAPSSFSDYPF